MVEFFRKYQPVDEPTIQAETDRYIAWPAQALSYKLGQLKFRELRSRAQQQLGSKFDIRSFHDEMLNGGVLPLDLLDSRTKQWLDTGAVKSGVKEPRLVKPPQFEPAMHGRAQPGRAGPAIGRYPDDDNTN